MSRGDRGRGNIPHDPGGGNSDRDYFGRRVRFEDESRDTRYGIFREDRILAVEKMTNELHLCHDLIEKGRQVVQKLFLELTRRKRKLQEKCCGRTDRLCEVDQLMAEIDILNKALQISHLQKEEYIKQLGRLKDAVLTDQHQVQSMLEISRDNSKDLIEKMDAFRNVSQEQEALIQKLKRDNECLWEALTNLQNRMDEDRSLPESPDLSVRINKGSDAYITKYSPESSSSTQNDSSTDTKMEMASDDQLRIPSQPIGTSSLSKKLQKLLEQSENVQKLIATVGTKSRCGFQEIEKANGIHQKKPGIEASNISDESDSCSTSNDTACSQCANTATEDSDVIRRITVEDLLKRCKEIEMRIKRCSPAFMRDHIMRQYEMMERPVKIGKFGGISTSQSTQSESDRLKRDFSSSTQRKMREELIQYADQVKATENDFKTAQSEMTALKSDLHILLDEKCAQELNLRREVTDLRTIICSKDAELEALRKQLRDMCTDETRPLQREKENCKRCEERKQKSSEVERSEIAVDKANISSLNEEVKRLKKALDKKNIEIDELRNEMIDAVENIESLRAIIKQESTQTDNEEMKKEIQRLTEENKNLKRLEEEGIGDELSLLQKAIEDAEVKLRRMKREKEEVLSKLREREQTALALEEENNRLNQEGKDLIERLQSLETQFRVDEEAQQRSAELEAKLEELQTTTNGMSKEFKKKEKNMTQTLHDKDEQIGILRETLQITEETCQKLKQSLQHNEEEIGNLTKQLEATSRASATESADLKQTLEMIYQNSIENVKDLKKENSELKIQLKERTSKEECSKCREREITEKEGGKARYEEKEPSSPSVFEGNSDLSLLRESVGDEGLKLILQWLLTEGITIKADREVFDSRKRTITTIQTGEKTLLETFHKYSKGRDVDFLRELLIWSNNERLTLNEEGTLVDSAGKSITLLQGIEPEIFNEIQRFMLHGGDRNALHVLRWLVTEGIHFDNQDQLVDGQGRIIQAATPLGYKFARVLQDLVENEYDNRDIDNLLRWIRKHKPRINDDMELIDGDGNRLSIVREDLAKTAAEVSDKYTSADSESVSSVLERGIRLLPNGNFQDKFGIIYRHSNEEEDVATKKLQEEIESLRVKMDNLETSKEEDTTANKLEEAEEKLFMKELENDKLRKEIDDSYSKLQEYEKELHAINQNLQDLAASRDKVLTTSNKEKSELLDKLRSEEKTFKSSIENMSGLIEKLNVDKSVLEDELAKAKEVIGKLKTKSKNLQDEVNVEIDKQRNIEEERERWSDLRSAFEEEIARLNAELKSKEELVDELGRARSSSRGKITPESSVFDENEGEIKTDKNIELKKLYAENQLLRSKFASLEDETTATTKVIADMERGHGHLTGALRCHLVLQKPATAKLLENSLQTYYNEHENLKKKFEMVETKYDKEGNYSSRRDFARELFENAYATINNIQSILDQGLIKVEDDLEKDFSSNEDFEVTDYKARLWILRRRLSDVEKRHRELQLKAEELSIRLDAKTAEFEVTQDELEDATRDLETNENSMTKMRMELDSCLRENLQLKEILNQLREQHDFAVETVLNENEELKQKVSGHSVSKDNVIEALQSDVEDLRGTLASRERDLMDQSMQNSQRKIEMEKLKSRIMELEGLLSRTETQNELLQKQMESMRAGARYHHHHGTIHLLRDDLKKLWNENTKLKEDLLKKQKTINEMSRELRSARTETREQRDLGEKLEKRLMESGKASESPQKPKTDIGELKNKLKKSDSERFKIEQEKYKLELKYENDLASAQAKINELVSINERLLRQIEQDSGKGEKVVSSVTLTDTGVSLAEHSESVDSLDVFQGSGTSGKQIRKDGIKGDKMAPASKRTETDNTITTLRSESSDSLDVFQIHKPVKNVLEASDDSLVLYSGSGNTLNQSIERGSEEEGKMEELRTELKETLRQLDELREENKKLNEILVKKDTDFRLTLSKSILESEEIVKAQGDSMQSVLNEKTDLVERLSVLEKENQLLKNQGRAKSQEAIESEARLNKRITELEGMLSERESVLKLTQARATDLEEELLQIKSRLSPNQWDLSFGSSYLSGKESPEKSNASRRAKYDSRFAAHGDTQEDLIFPADETTPTAERFHFPMHGLREGSESRVGSPTKIPRPKKREAASPSKVPVSKIPMSSSPKPRKKSKEMAHKFDRDDTDNVGDVNEEEMRLAIQAVDHLTKEVSNLKKELQEARVAKAKLPELETELSTLRLENDRLKLEIKDLNHKIMKHNNNKAEMTRLKQELKETREAKKRIPELEKDNASLREESEKSRTHNKELINKLSKHSNGRSEITKLRQELKEANEAKKLVTQLQETNASLQQEIKKLNSRISDLKSKISKRRAETNDEFENDMTSQTTNNDEELQRLYRELQSKESEIEFLKLELKVKSSKTRLQGTDSQGEEEHVGSTRTTSLSEELASATTPNVTARKAANDLVESDQLKEHHVEDQENMLLRKQLDEVSKDWEEAVTRTIELETELLQVREELKIALEYYKELTRLDTENASLKEQLTSAKEQAAAMANDNSTADDTFGTLSTVRKELKEKEKLISNYEESQAIRDDTIQTLEAQVSEFLTREENQVQYKIKIEQLEEEKKMLHEDLSEIAKEKGEEMKKNAELQRQVISFTDEISKLDQQISMMEERLLQMKTENENLKKEISSATEERQKLLEEHEEEKTESSMNLLKLETENKNLFKKVEKLEGDLLVMSKAQNGKAETSMEVDSMGEEVEMSRQLLDQQREEQFLQLQSELLQKDDEIEHLRKQIETEKKSQETVTAEKQMLQKNVEQLRKKRNSLKESLDQFKSQSTTIVTVVEEFEEIVEGNEVILALEEKLKEREKKVSELTIALELATREDQDDEESDIELKVSDTESQGFRELLSRVAEMEVELIKNQRKIENAEKKRMQVVGDLQSLQEEYESVKIKYERIQNEMKETSKFHTQNLLNLEMHRDELIQSLVEKESEINKLVKEVESLTSEISSLRSSLDEAVNSPRDSVGSLDSDSSLRDSERQFITDSSKDWKRKLLAAYRDLKEKSVEIATLRMNLECRSIEMEYDRDAKALAPSSTEESKRDSDKSLLDIKREEESRMLERVRLLEADLEEKETKVIVLEEELTDLRSKTMTMEEKQATVQGDESLQREQYEEKISSQIERIQDLVSQNEKKAKKITELQNNLQEQNQSVRQLNADLDKLEEKYRHEVMKRQGWMQEKDDTASYKDAKLKELENELAQAEAQIENLKSANKQYDSAHSTLKREIKDLRNEVQAKEQAIQAAASVAAEADSKTSDNERLREQLDMQRQRYELEIKSLKSSLSALKSEHVGSMNTDYDRVITERMELQVVVTELEEDIARKQNTLDEMFTRNRFLEIELSTAKSRISDLIDELADQEEENRRLSDGKK